MYGGLKVPKTAVRVELVLAGRGPRAVEFFVSEDPSHPLVLSRVIGLLEQGEPFLPARDVEAGTFVLVHKDSVLWLGLDASPADEEDELFDVRRDVRVELEGGDPLEGELLYTPPADAARVVDLLNHPGRFFRLWRAGAVLLVNKRFVQLVVEAPSAKET